MGNHIYIPKLKWDIRFHPLRVKAKYKRRSRFKSIGMTKRLEPRTVIVALNDPNTINVDMGQSEPVTLYKWEKNVTNSLSDKPVPIITTLNTIFFFINLNIVYPILF